MRRSISLVVFALAVVIAAGPVLATAGSWTGWVTDSHCGAKGAKAGHEDCARKCVKGGGKYVFYNTADQKLYKLDKQELAAEHLGHEVEVKGTLDGDAIAVESIAAKQ